MNDISRIDAIILYMATLLHEMRSTDQSSAKANVEPNRAIEHARCPAAMRMIGNAPRNSLNSR
jgi:hypothetical protein